MLKFNIKKKDSNYIKLWRILPNMVTLCSLGIGITSILYSMQNIWQTAIIMILISGILDGIDGRLARILSADSAFGAELDSLCDFVNFGIAPSLLTYLWILNYYSIEHSIFVWSVILLFCMCMAIRLARFNTTNNQLDYYKKFSIGVPAPCGAMLFLFPIILSFTINTYEQFNFSLNLYICYILFVSFLSVSRIPTISLKNISIKHEYIKPIFLLLFMLTICIILFLWHVMISLIILYFLSIPITAYYGLKMQNKIQNFNINN
ncbi:MAG: phosphatidylcholine/phosphatidylserine synthase [Rickettsiales bacterium]